MGQSIADTVGIDFGATTIKGGRVGPAGRIWDRFALPTRGTRGPEAVLTELAEQVRRLAEDGPVRGVGLGFCGFVDAAQGVVLATTDTLPGWDGLALATALERRCGLPTRCDNDANAAALGEARLGVGRGEDSLVMLTLGTGVGGGIVLHGQVWRGAGQSAGHLGHLTVEPGGRRCACGARGCLEAYASSWGFRQVCGLDAEAVFAAAREGDPDMQRLVRQAGEALGVACAQIAVTLNPALLAIGGGIARSWDLLEPHVGQRYRDEALAPAAASTRIAVSRLGQDAGILGAALLVEGAAAPPG